MYNDQELSTMEAKIEEHKPSEHSTIEYQSSPPNNETSIKLPLSPPVHGRSKIKKKKHRNAENTENVFQARKRTREEKDLP
ncbi:hypothetical protein CHS0354_007300 [Potamilus streckersoni]|uniref:Uncharacterized protein n=1 Tax=Potamilus streckersoni TaxID=2493646 RepID=A0AAE0TE26_9BIVA|nr:hypothetical protein CHS0354_007300 [Potamilus streckersoni]